MSIVRIAGAVALATALAACQNEAPVSGRPTPALSHAQEAAPPLPSNISVSTNAAVPAESAVSAKAASLNVPRAVKAITPSDKFEVNVWGGAVNTHTLLDARGKGAVPVSEARFLWRDDQLYLGFYAGDLDLEMREKKHDGAVWKDDSVTFSFFVPGDRKRVLTISPLGTLADGTCPNDAESLADPRCDLHWESHVKSGVDYDGTVNKLGDFDEEWNIQLAIPLAAIAAKAVAGTHIPMTIRRCDIAFDGQRECGLWGNPEHPAELVLE